MSQTVSGAFVVTNHAKNLDDEAISSLVSFVTSLEVCPTCSLNDDLEFNRENFSMRINLAAKQIEVFDVKEMINRGKTERTTDG